MTGGREFRRWQLRQKLRFFGGNFCGILSQQNRILSVIMYLSLLIIFSVASPKRTQFTRFECPFSRGVWRALNVTKQTHMSEQTRTIDYLPLVVHMNPEMTQEIIVVVAWGIWNKCCELFYLAEVINKKPITIKYINWAIRMVEEYDNSIGKLKGQRGKNPWKETRELITRNPNSILIFHRCKL